MTDISVIILIGREKMHLKRCIEKLAPLEPKCIYLVESRSDDGGVAVAKAAAQEYGLKLESVFNAWPGTQSVQFNWALDHLPLETEWVLRLDADEYLTEEGIKWLKVGLATLPKEIAALEFKLERKFMGGTIRHATNSIRMVRIFRKGRARYADTLMDERLEIDGNTLAVPVTFYDDNLNSFQWWKEKHRGYAKREAQQALDGSSQDPRKISYYMLPPYFRVCLYFFIRYVVRGGFLDGVTGWRWNFWQGFWYRWIVDREIARLKHEGPETTGVNLAKYKNRHGIRNFFVRFVWKLVWTVLARPTPRWILNGWRVFILKCFKARIGAKCRVPGGTDIWYPSRLTMGRSVWIDVNVKLYCVNRITLGNNVIISDGAYLCTAQHDITDPAFALTTAPITIGDSAWIGARAIILPGRKVGEGAVVAAGAVVTRDVEPWTVVAGNPARVIKKRDLRK